MRGVTEAEMTIIEEKRRAYGAAKKKAEQACARMLSSVQMEKRDINSVCDSYVTAAKALAAAVRAYAGDRHQ